MTRLSDCSQLSISQRIRDNPPPGALPRGSARMTPMRSQKWLGQRMVITGILCLAILPFIIYVSIRSGEYWRMVPGVLGSLFAGPWLLVRGWKRIRAEHSPHS